MSENEKSEVRSQKLGDEGIGSDQLLVTSYQSRRWIKQGGKTMNSKSVVAEFTRRIAIGLVGVVVLGVGMMVEKAHAIAFSTNNATALTVRIRPNVDRGVEISSSGVSLDFGLVDLSASTKTVTNATVTIMGNVSTTELNMTSTITAFTAGEKSWEFDDDPSNLEADRLASWVLFTSNTYSGGAPSDYEFGVANATVTQVMAPLSGTGVRIGGSSGNGSRFEHEGGGATYDMDSMAPATRRGMWVRMRNPSTTSATGIQDVTFQLNVVTTGY